MPNFQVAFHNGGALKAGFGDVGDPHVGNLPKSLSARARCATLGEFKECDRPPHSCGVRIRRSFAIAHIPVSGDCNSPGPPHSSSHTRRSSKPRTRKPGVRNRVVDLYRKSAEKEPCGRQKGRARGRRRPSLAWSTAPSPRAPIPLSQRIGQTPARTSNTYTCSL